MTVRSRRSWRACAMGLPVLVAACGGAPLDQPRRRLAPWCRRSRRRAARRLAGTRVAIAGQRFDATATVTIGGVDAKNVTACERHAAHGRDRASKHRTGRRGGHRGGAAGSSGQRVHLHVLLRRQRRARRDQLDYGGQSSGRARRVRRRQRGAEGHGGRDGCRDARVRSDFRVGGRCRHVHRHWAVGDLEGSSAVRCADDGENHPDGDRALYRHRCHRQSGVARASRIGGYERVGARFGEGKSAILRRPF